MAFDVLFQTLQMVPGYTPSSPQDVANKAYVDSAVAPVLPAGMIVAFGGRVAPPGWLMCDGSPVSKAANANLFAAIGTSYGAGDSTNTLFNLPDLRGKFPRGTDNMGTPAGAAGLDPDILSRSAQPGGAGFVLAGCGTTGSSAIVTVPSTSDLAPGMTVSGTNIPLNTVARSVGVGQITLGNGANTANVNATSGGTVSLTFGGAATGNYVGSVQVDAMQGHRHGDGANPLGPISQQFTGGPSAFVGTAGGTPLVTMTDGSNGSPRTSSESRPKNVYVNYIIKT